MTEFARAATDSTDGQDVGRIEVRTRSYVSTTHLWMADHCARFTRDYEATHRTGRAGFHIHQRAYAMTAVTESVAFVEALINEFYVDIYERHGGVYDMLDGGALSRIRDYWTITGSGNNVSILSKYEMARSLCSLERYDKGADPYQSMKAVIDLRNWQMHYRPKSVGETASYEIAKRLTGKFRDCELMSGSGNAWFPDRAMGAGCAQWAVNSARAFADDFVGQLGAEPNYRVVMHPIGPPPPPQ